MKVPVVKLVIFLNGSMLHNWYADFNSHIWLHIYPEGQSALLRVTSKWAHYREDLWCNRSERWRSALRWPPPAYCGSSLAGAARRGVGMFLRCAKTGSPMWLVRNVMFNKGCFHSPTKSPSQGVWMCTHRGEVVPLQYLSAWRKYSA